MDFHNMFFISHKKVLLLSKRKIQTVYIMTNPGTFPHDMANRVPFYSNSDILFSVSLLQFC